MPVTPSDARTMASLREATDRLGVIQADIRALAKRTDEAWRHDLIALRRRLQREVAGLAELMAPPGTRGDDFRPLRGAFGRMRSTVALHQADWPAVAVDRDDSGYKVSVQGVRAANRELVALVAALVPRGTHIDANPIRKDHSS